MYVYALRDNVGERYLSLSIAYNDEDFVRSSLFAIMVDYPISEVSAYRIGWFDELHGFIRPIKPIKVEWTAHQFPSTMDSLEPEYLSIEDMYKKALEKRKEFDSMMNDKVEDFDRLIKDVENALHDDRITEEQKNNLIDYKSTLEKSRDNLKFQIENRKVENE